MKRERGLIKIFTEYIFPMLKTFNILVFTFQIFQSWRRSVKVMNANLCLFLLFKKIDDEGCLAEKMKQVIEC